MLYFSRTTKWKTKVETPDAEYLELWTPGVRTEDMNQCLYFKRKMVYNNSVVDLLI